MIFFPKDPKNKFEFKAYSLVMPAVSVGNIGQLTIDVLVATIKAERIGYIYHEALLPMTGNDPYSADSNACQLSTCCDVYQSEQAKLVVIQQRASFVKGKRKRFREELMEWIKEQSFQKVILVTSTYSHMRTDEQIARNAQFRYLCTEGLLNTMQKIKGWVALEDSPDSYGTLGKQMPGSGIAKTLLSDCSKEGINLAVLVAFCSEGDNAPDALYMVSCLNQLINVKSLDWQPNSFSSTSLSELRKTWTIPPSWSLNFGNSFQQFIY